MSSDEASIGCLMLFRCARSNLRALAFAAAASTLVAGCAPPIGVRHLTPLEANRALTANVFTTGVRSAYSARVLQRFGLAEQFDEDAPAVLEQLRAGLGGRDEDERLLALAELSFEHALESGDRASFLAAAAYAWAFLFPEDEHPCAGPYEDRLRLAADLYGRGIALGLVRKDKKREIDLRPRRIALAFGDLELEIPPDALFYAGYALHNFVSLADLEVRGLRNRYRRRGIGAPLAAGVRRVEGQEASKWVGQYAKIPLTLVLRFDRPREALREGRLRARAELYDPDVTDAVVGKQKVPIESDRTAVLAYRLDGSPIWDFELAGFRKGDFLPTRSGTGTTANLLMPEAYRKGRIPIVFVHGTASSPARWAQLTNELISDPEIGARYQFWYFIYNSGNPIALSGAALRDALTSAVADLDPAGKDAALRRMVLIGHSQGGLLVKMMVVESGTRFWDAISKVPFEQAKLSDETRRELEHAMFFEPLPFIERVVFMATPHGGSYLTENPLSSLVRRLVTMPSNLLHMSQDIVRLNAQGVFRQPFRMPTSLDNMNASNPFLRTLRSLPIRHGVKVNSIVAVQEPGDPDKENDGVVAYKSAHIDGVESELVVHSGHSVQEQPLAIEEVRRILYLHLGAGSPEPSPANLR